MGGLNFKGVVSEMFTVQLHEIDGRSAAACPFCSSSSFPVPRGAVAERSTMSRTIGKLESIRHSSCLFRAP